MSRTSLLRASIRLTSLIGVGSAALATSYWVYREPHSVRRDGKRVAALTQWPHRPTRFALCEQVQEVVEQELVPGINYKEHLDEGTTRLVGAGMRRMTPLKIKVYAIGLYMTEMAMTEALSSWHGQSAGEVYESEEFWSLLCSPDVEKSVVMIVARTVTGKHMQQGFDRAMLKRVRALAREGRPGGKDALRKLNLAIVAAGPYDFGDQIRFEMREKGVMLLHLKDQPPITIENEALCIAFAEMFLGPRAASLEAKMEISNGFESMLNKPS